MNIIKSKMGRLRAGILGLAAFGMLSTGQALAANPLVSHVYTADPAATVIDGRVYVVVTHDQPTQTDYSQLVDYYLFSSDDMVNWQDHGIIWNSRENTSWANLAYAPDLIERNGKFYLYFPDGGGSIGVAVADSPEGPYHDPLGRPLVDRNTPNGAVEWIFDPGLFIDDNGQAYLYFGGGGPGNARVIRLNDDMISTQGSAVNINAPNFFEALHMHKRNGTYYLTYSTNSAGGMSIDYMTSSNPMQGFTYRGTILDNPWENNNNNNHQSIIEFKDQWYIFYHNRAVANARGASTYQRSVNVDRLFYNADGSIQRVNDGPAGVPPVKNLNAFAVNQAETFAEESGIKTEPAREGSQNLMMGYGAWVKIANVDFGSGANEIRVRVATEGGSSMDVVLGDVNNAPLVSMNLDGTGGWQTWQTQSAQFDTVTGVHDVYIRSTAYHNLDWFQFVGADGPVVDPVEPGEPAGKFLGNIVDNGNTRFSDFWNQVTPENSGKWEAVEPSRDNYNWGKMDEGYNFARANGYPYKAHTFVWGSQEPGWLGSISNAERAGEVAELMRDTCRRYPNMDMIDVVNEPISAPSNARWGLGGDGSTGWDWIIRSFELARQYCPNSKLLLNEYGIINDRRKATEYRRIVELLRDRGLIDGVGMQAHSFNLVGYSPETLRGNLDYMAAAGVPLYISEWDIDAASDQDQLREYQQKFPVVWEHPAVVGVTLWGYIAGRTWMDNSGLMYNDGRERPALTWLNNYVGQTATPTPPGEGNGGGVVVRARGAQGDEHINLVISGEVVADWTLSTSMADYVYRGNASGDIQVRFDNDDTGRDVQVDYIQVNNETRQAEDMEYNTGAYNGSCGGGSYSEWLHCDGAIGFGNSYDCFSGNCGQPSNQSPDESTSNRTLAERIAERLRARFR